MRTRSPDGFLANQMNYIHDKVDSLTVKFKKAPTVKEMYPPQEDGISESEVRRAQKVEHPMGILDLQDLHLKGLWALINSDLGTTGGKLPAEIELHPATAEKLQHVKHNPNAEADILIFTDGSAGRNFKYAGRCSSSTKPLKTFIGQNGKNHHRPTSARHDA